MPHRRVALIACVLVVAVTALAFAPVVRNEFVNFDDTMYVTQNPTVQRGLTADGLRWALTTTTAGNWHPLTWLSHMLDQQLFGGKAAGHHLTSLVLHVTNAAVLFLAVHAATGALWPSAVVAMLFGVHPLHVESVAWVAERKDVLSTLFFALGMWAYVAYARRGGALRYAAVVMSVALGLMAKPMLATFPFVLLLLDYWPLARLRGAPHGAPTDAAPMSAVRPQTPVALIVEKLPLVALALVSVAATVHAQRAVGAVRSTVAFPVTSRLANAVLAYVAYLRKTVWPDDLAIFYPYPSRFDAWRVAAAVLVLAGISALAFALARRARYVLVGWLWYLGMLVPVIGLVQVGHQSMADRYSYLPLVGIFIAVVFAACALVERLRIPVGVLAVPAAVAIVACVVVTRVQIAQWRTSVTLFTHALAVTRDNYMAHQGLGEALAAGEGRRDEAIEHFREAIRLAPTLVEAHTALADALLEAHQDGEAIAHYAEALRLKPNDDRAYAKLGAALWRSGRLAEAAAAFEEAVRIAPDDAQNLSNLGALLLTLGRADEARERFAAAVQRDPSNPAAHGNLGLLLAQTGRRDEAEHELEEALRLQPRYPEAHYNLGNLLLAEGRIADAAAHYAASLEANPNQAEVHNNLGVALERLGRRPEARAHFAEAVRLRPDLGDAAANAARLDAGGG